jgi:SAM-dependent methyltransferase
MPEFRQADSIYDDHDAIAAEVNMGKHRDIVGGLWDEIGDLQFNFLRSHELRQDDRLLDIGCGSLRGGIRFIAYLRPGNYWGIDSNAALLEAGYGIELAASGLTSRLPRDRLLCDSEFRFDRLSTCFDVAVAQSLFTHLSANRIRLCLYRLAAVMRPGGRLFATFFQVDEQHPFDREFVHPRGATTYGFKDPFHYRLSEFEGILSGLPWQMTWVGDWEHPRSQKIAILQRLSNE